MDRRSIEAAEQEPERKIAAMAGRTQKAVQLKRFKLGIRAEAPLVRRWTAEEDEVVLSTPVTEAARLLNRTPHAVKDRRRKLRRESAPDVERFTERYALPYSFNMRALALTTLGGGRLLAAAETQSILLPFKRFVTALPFSSAQ